jgi:hypothetical protein
MRFAGTRMEGFLSDDRPEYGDLAQKGSTLLSKESSAATDLMGKTASTGIAAAGAVEASEITGAAAAGLAEAQGNASMMSSIGGIASSAIGAFGGGGGGGGVSSFGATPKTSSIDYSSAFSNPNFYSLS